MATERRRDARKKEGNHVVIEALSQDRADAAAASTKKISFSLTEDISIKGIKVISEAFFPIDTLLKIELSLEELSEPLSLQGKVKWVKPVEGNLCEIGIEFIGASPDQKKLLVDHMYRYEEEI